MQQIGPNPSRQELTKANDSFVIQVTAYGKCILIIHQPDGYCMYRSVKVQISIKLPFEENPLINRVTIVWAGHHGHEHCESSAGDIYKEGC